MTKKPSKKPNKAPKKTKKIAYSDILKYYSKREDEIKNIIIVLLVIGLVSCLLYMGTTPEDVQEIPEIETDASDNQDIPPAQVGDKQDIDITFLEMEIHDNVNEKRVELGFSELVWNTILNTVARNHSKDMAENDYFSHEDPRGNDFSDRYNEESFNCMVFSGSLIFRGDENLFLITHDMETQEELARIVVDGWMDSFEHRQKILKSYWKTEGIGAAISGNNIYITQNFC